MLASLESPLLPSPLLLEAMPALADMLPTLLESSTSPRGPLMLSPRLMLMPTTMAMVPTPMPMVLMAMLDMLLPTPMDTMERGLLMLSPRLMLMPTMATMATVPTPMPVPM